MEEALEDVRFYGPRQGDLGFSSPMSYEDAIAFINRCADSDWAGHDYDGFSGIRHDYFIVSTESEMFDIQRDQEDRNCKTFKCPFFVNVFSNKIWADVEQCQPWESFWIPSAV